MVARLAFTLIELIFAIVIIAISVLSLPMVTQIIGTNIERSIVQEAILAASSELNQVVSYRWDENSLDSNTSFLSRVVWISDADCNTTTFRRPGHINQPNHRRCSDNTTARPTDTFGLELGEVIADDLDDINTTVHDIFIVSGGATANASQTGYKKTYSSTFDISYKTIDPTNYAVHNNNIKRIRVTLSNADGNVTQLTTFSSNIGEIDYYKRSY